ncbi:hypothetical protein HK101_010824 [Irineochytrium annulatum]|nr:hypothetical protein HK101_010824 [Irineochytrium annulatum]
MAGLENEWSASASASSKPSRTAAIAVANAKHVARSLRRARQKHAESMAPLTNTQAIRHGNGWKKTKEGRAVLPMRTRVQRIVSSMDPENPNRRLHRVTVLDPTKAKERKYIRYRDDEANSHTADAMKVGRLWRMSLDPALRPLGVFEPEVSAGAKAVTATNISRHVSDALLKANGMEVDDDDDADERDEKKRVRFAATSRWWEEEEEDRLQEERALRGGKRRKAATLGPLIVMDEDRDVVVETAGGTDAALLLDPSKVRSGPQVGTLKAAEEDARRLQEERKKSLGLLWDVLSDEGQDADRGEPIGEPRVAYGESDAESEELDEPPKPVANLKKEAHVKAPTYEVTANLRALVFGEDEPAALAPSGGGLLSSLFSGDVETEGEKSLTTIEVLGPGLGGDAVRELGGATGGAAMGKTGHFSLVDALGLAQLERETKRQKAEGINRICEHQQNTVPNEGLPVLKSSTFFFLHMDEPELAMRTLAREVKPTFFRNMTMDEVMTTWEATREQHTHEFKRKHKSAAVGLTLIGLFTCILLVSTFVSDLDPKTKLDTAAIASTPTVRTALTPGTVLLPGDTLRSKSSQFCLHLHVDGRLEFTEARAPILDSERHLPCNCSHCDVLWSSGAGFAGWPVRFVAELGADGVLRVKRSGTASGITEKAHCVLWEAGRLNHSAGILAVIVVGLARTYRQTCKSHMENIFDRWPGKGVHVFVYTYMEDSGEDDEIKVVQNFQECYGDRLKHIRVNHLSNVSEAYPGESVCDRAHINRLYSQIKSLHLAGNEFKNYTAKHRVIYDSVLRMRPDHMITAPFSPLAFRSPPPGTLLIPMPSHEHLYWCGLADGSLAVGVTDQFAFGSVASMIIYLDFFKSFPAVYDYVTYNTTGLPGFVGCMDSYIDPCIKPTVYPLEFGPRSYASPAEAKWVARL